MTRAASSLGLRTLLLLLAGCRFGGPTGSATALIEPDGAIPDGGNADSDDMSMGDGDDSPDTPEEDAAAPGDGDDSDDDSAIEDGGSSEDGGTHEEEQCAPFNVPGCDPVSGTGCTMGINQCIVDRSATTAAGRCVFSPAQPSIGECTQDDFSSTCPFLFTCIEGECRKYCYCDSDCGPGDICGESNEQGAAAIFRLCVATRPLLTK